MTAKELKAKLDEAKIVYKKTASVPELTALWEQYEADKVARELAQGTTTVPAGETQEPDASTEPDAPTEASPDAPASSVDVPDDAEITSTPTTTTYEKVDIYGMRDDGKYGYVRTFARDRHGDGYLEMAHQFVNNPSNVNRLLQVLDYDPAAALDRGVDK